MFKSPRPTDDLGYKEGDMTLCVEQKSKKRHASVKFIRKTFPESYSDLNQRNIMYLKRAWKIGNGKKPFVDVGCFYHLESGPRRGTVSKFRK